MISTDCHFIFQNMSINDPMHCLNGILIQSFFKNSFACNIFDPYICAVLCIVEHATRPHLPNKRFVLTIYEE